MRSVVLALGFAGSATVLAASLLTGSCQVQTEPLEAGPDQSAPQCTTSAQCSGGAVCAYPTLAGCGAVGQCFSFGAENEAGGEVPASTMCGCDGRTVKIPAGWGGFAPAPVLMNGPATCPDGASSADSSDR
jgi:hypothetical protein